MRQSIVPGQFIGYDVYGNTVAYSYDASNVTRDDTESTIPVNGKFVLPTGYYAKWITKRPGDLKWDYRGYTSLEPIDPPYFTEDRFKYQTPHSFANLINSALKNAADSKMTLGETMGEIPSSAAMIAKNARALAEFYSRLRRGDTRGALRAVGADPRRRKRNLPSDAASKYLELIYGWLPLYEEAYNAMDVIHNGVAQPPDNGLVVGYAGDSASSVEEVLMYSITGNQQELEWHVTSGAHVKFVYAYNHESKARAFNQLGILNPVSIAWNLLPSSFLIDWWLPIGDYLDAFSAPAGLTLKSGYSASKSEAVYSAKPSPVPPSLTKRCTRVPECTVGSAVRHTHGDQPQLPRVRVPNSISQAQSAVALLLQRARF